MGEVFHWFSHLHIGKWITDNTQTLGTFFTLITVLVKWLSDSRSSKKIQVELSKQKVASRQENNEIMRKIDQNTAVTVATAQQAGVPMATLLDHIDNGFDELLQRKLTSDIGKQEGPDDEQAGSGRGRSHN